STAETDTAKIPPLTEETPQFRNITIKNLICRGASQAILLQGLPELNLEGIKLENIVIQADNGLACIDASGVTIKGMKLIPKDSAALQFINSQNVNIEKLNVPGSQDPLIIIKGEKSKNITIRFTEPGKKTRTVIGDEVDAKTIQVL
ncbi:MAG: hypothetical protein ABSA76_12710, partial [Bacteroidales bacterium]